MRRASLVSGLAFAIAATTLLVIAPGGDFPTASPGTEEVVPGSRAVGTCPGTGPILPAHSSSYRLAADVARRFVTAWWSRDSATAFALADASFRGDASVLADGANRGSPTFVVSSIGPLGHGMEGDTIARVCGPDVLPA